MSEANGGNSENTLNDRLVAYLDGELDADESLQIERRLASDDEFRSELQQLQRAWDMLDDLPKSEVSESFTQTTVEMVVLSAEHELQEQEKEVRQRGHWWWLVAVGGFVATALVSYWMIAAYLSRPNEQLARDLPLIENVELYRSIDSIDYLRMLEESGLFEEEVDDAM
jgi:anti-sigma factor RsiW